MGIEVYEGVLGGGKSYHACLHALEYLAHGGRVYSNITMVREKCEEWCLARYGVKIQWEEQFTYLTADDIARLHQVVRGGTKDSPTLCILDEIHLYHNARDWAHASRGLLQWLTQSRKIHVDVICITQHRNNLDKQWIRLVYRYWRFRDLRKLKLPGLPFGIPFFQCLACSYDIDGRTQLSRKFERFDTSVFSCYNSDQLFDGVADFADSGLTRVDLEHSPRKFPRWAVVSLLVLLLCVGAGCGACSRLRNGSNKTQLPAPSPDTVPSEVKPAKAPLPPPTPPSPYVVCSSWWARDGKVTGGCSVDRRLVFSGPPDGIEGGLPRYHHSRGIAY